VTCAVEAVGSSLLRWLSAAPHRLVVVSHYQRNRLDVGSSMRALLPSSRSLSSRCRATQQVLGFRPTLASCDHSLVHPKNARKDITSMLTIRGPSPAELALRGRAWKSLAQCRPQSDVLCHSSGTTDRLPFTRLQLSLHTPEGGVARLT